MGSKLLRRRDTVRISLQRMDRLLLRDTDSNPVMDRLLLLRDTDSNPVMVRLLLLLDTDNLDTDNRDMDNLDTDSSGRSMRRLRLHRGTSCRVDRLPFRREL
jgi:hypothetical protein